ncbi:hypothetical protein ACJD0Z_08070 [Flavobacteriaceae bacterium M23B6Z8]
MKTFLVRCLLFFLVFMAINMILAFVYERPVKKAIANKTHKNYLKWTDIHNHLQSYDIIIMGSSRAYTAYNPEILDSVTGLKSYNMGTSAQDIAETYYMLKELLEYQQPKFVVMDLFFPSSDTDHEYYQIFSNASFFNSGEQKFNLVTEGYGTEGVVNYLLPIVKLKNYIKNDLSTILGPDRPEKKEDHWIRGFLYDTTIVTEKQIEKFTPISNFKNTSFSEERFNFYMKRIMSLLKDNNIKFITIHTPYPPARNAISSKRDEEDYFTKFTENNHLPFYDFNRMLPEMENADFSDYHHTNYKGARKVSIALGEIIKSTQ